MVRHLNTPAGERDPDLTARGAARRDRARRPGSAREPPRAIYVSDFRRTRQTAAPLAARLGLDPDRLRPSRHAGADRAGPRQPGPVLIVGHSNTVPDIVEQLGGTRPGPLVHEDFGDIWRIGPDGATQRLRIEQ